jgi:hypothetical protein
VSLDVVEQPFPVLYALSYRGYRPTDAWRLCGYKADRDVGGDGRFVW